MTDDKKFKKKNRKKEKYQNGSLSHSKKTENKHIVNIDKQVKFNPSLAKKRREINISCYLQKMMKKKI